MAVLPTGNSLTQHGDSTDAGKEHAWVVYYGLTTAKILGLCFVHEDAEQGFKDLAALVKRCDVCGLRWHLLFFWSFTPVRMSISAQATIFAVLNGLLVLGIVHNVAYSDVGCFNLQDCPLEMLLVVYLICCCFSFAHSSACHFV